MDIEQEERFEKYKASGFSEEQLFEIRRGIEEGLDITLYSRNAIPASEMAYIRKALFLKKEQPQEDKPLEEENYEEIEKQFREYRETIRANIYEKIIAFAITLSGLAIIAALYTMIMVWPVVRGL